MSENFFKGREIKLEHAVKITSLFKSATDYAEWNLLYTYDEENGEADDNSLESAEYWEKCKRIVEESKEGIKEQKQIFQSK